MINIRQTCRVCGRPLKIVFDLGQFPIVGYDDAMKREVSLCLTRCDSAYENACGLVQLRDTVPGFLMYEQYFYLSGMNENMLNHLHGLGDEAVEISGVKPDDLIVDIGCNDGSLLLHYASKGFKNLAGFDPAKNISHVISKDKAKIIRDYFDSSSVKCLQQSAKLISSVAMFYDLEDPHDFVRAIDSCLSDDGVWVLELSYLPSMLSQNSFDTICNEHLQYYSISSLEYLLNCHDFQIIDIFLNSSNGGSFRVYVTKKRAREISSNASNRIRKLKLKEFELALDTDRPYNEFIARVKANGDYLRSFLEAEKEAGKKIHAYGASTKGFTTLKYYGIDNSLIEKCADRNESKWGTVMRGLGIPIVSEEESRADQPDYFLILPWHFLDGFIEREKKFLEGGGKFIVPMPEFKILDKSCIKR